MIINWLGLSSVKYKSAFPNVSCLCFILIIIILYPVDFGTIDRDNEHYDFI